MFLRVLIAGVVAFGLLPRATGEDQLGTHAGIVVRVEGSKITLADKGGKNEHSHTVPASATVTCDGKPCRLQDLKKGMPVSITVERQGDKAVVTRVDAKKEPEQPLRR
jgi:hypothetical protein